MFDILFGEFRSTATNFSKFFIGGCLFAIVGHLTFVLPYLHDKEQVARTHALLQQHMLEQRTIKKHVAAIKHSAEILKPLLSNVEREIEQYPDHLRAVLPEIEDTLSSRRGRGDRPGPLRQPIPDAAQDRSAPIQQAPPISSSPR